MTDPTALSLIMTSSTPTDRAFWLNAAHQAVRRECGWHVAPIITETLVLDGRGGKALLLPSKRVREVMSVLNDGTDVTDAVRFSRRSGVLTLASGWSTEVGSIEVTLEHGYSPAEAADVAGIIAAASARGASTAAAGAVIEQSVGGARVRYGSDNKGGILSVQLLESEKTMLAQYKLNWGA